MRPVPGFRIGRCATAILAAATILVLATTHTPAAAQEGSPDTPPTAVSLIQVTTYPGQDGSARTERSTLYLAPGLMTVVPDDPQGVALIIRAEGALGGPQDAPGPGFWELDPATRTWQRHEADWLRDKRRRADTQRDRNREDIRSIRDADERRRVAQELGVNPEGDAPLRLVEDTEPSRDVAGRPCRRVRILRQPDPYLDRPEAVAIELWVTAEPLCASSVLDIYARVGLFNAEELSLLAQVQGFPLAWRAALPLDPMNDKPVELGGEVLRVLPTLPGPEVFRIPDGYRKWEPPVPRCPVCDKEVADTANNPFKLNHLGKWLQFCSRSCVDEWMLSEDE